MPTAHIRPASPADAAAVVALRALVHPYLVRGVESTRFMLANPPPGADWIGFVAESADGEIVGWASAFRNTATSEPGHGELSTLHVHPGHRGNGLGAALVEVGLAHLRGIGVRHVRAWARTEWLGFARARGFTPSRELIYLALDPAGAPEPPPCPPRLRIAPVSDLHPDALYAAHAAAAADEPGDVAPDHLSYDEWLYEVWENTGLDRLSSVAAVDGPEIVAFTLVKRDGERMWSDMTATMPSRRGQGLAYLLKCSALQRAKAGGVTMAYTSNDGGNAPMLAVNSRLGYRRMAAQWSCLAMLE